MARNGSSSKWSAVVTVIFGLGAVAFWTVGVGAGWRAWLLLDDLEPGRGLVAHGQAFGTDASVWWVPASVLTLTTVVLALGAVALRHLMPAGTTAAGLAGDAKDGDGGSGPDEPDEVQPEAGISSPSTTTS